MRSSGRDHILLGRAHIGHDRLSTERGRDPGEELRHLAHGRRKHEEIGVAHFLRPSLVERVGPIEDLLTERGIEVGAHTSDADDDLHRRGSPQGERERAADQSDADDDQLAQDRRGHRISGRAPS
jgi:hypothetical protein